MTDDKADNIPEPTEDVVTTEPQATPEANVEAPKEEENKLSGLMADPASPAPAEAKKPAVDLEKEALKAAEEALAKGEQALTEASEQLAEEAARPKAQPSKGSKRELALRVLLAVNVLAMVVVAMLPSPTTDKTVTPTETSKQDPVAQPSTPTPKMSEPWNQALRASERRDFASAVTILEGYLEDKPRMAPSERLSVLSSLSYYAVRMGDQTKSEHYGRMAQALEQSHSLPDDLVKEAAAALASGNQESLRRVWARFLLQQRQIPSWLYQHVAQAYLQLGDSYRKDADAAERKAQEQDLEAAAARLRAEAVNREGGK